jgi:hypothetical protein
MANALLLTQLLLQLGTQVAAAATTLQTAQAEGRDVTDAELQAALSAYLAAHTKLDSDIAGK